MLSCRQKFNEQSRLTTGDYVSAAFTGVANCITGAGGAGMMASMILTAASVVTTPIVAPVILSAMAVGGVMGWSTYHDEINSRRLNRATNAGSPRL